MRTILLVLLLAPSLACAQAGRLLLAAGDVIIVRGAQEIRATAGTALQSGDTIRVGPRSNAQLRMSDESIIALRADTLFRIDEYAYAGPNDESSRGIFSLVKGGMRTVGGRSRGSRPPISCAPARGRRRRPAPSRPPPRKSRSPKKARWSKRSAPPCARSPARSLRRATRCAFQRRRSASEARITRWSTATTTAMSRAAPPWRACSRKATRDPRASATWRRTAAMPR